MENAEKVLFFCEISKAILQWLLDDRNTHHGPDINTRIRATWRGCCLFGKIPGDDKEVALLVSLSLDSHIADQITVEASINDVSTIKAMFESTFGTEPFSQATVDGFLYQTISIDLLMHCETSKKLPIHSNAWNTMPKSCEDVHALFPLF